MTALLDLAVPAVTFVLLLAVGLDLAPADVARLRRQHRVLAAGLVDYNTVVSTLSALVGQQDQLASIQGTVAVNLVGVYLSLGGGWEGRQSANAVDLIPEQTKEEMRARGKYWGFPQKDK